MTALHNTAAGAIQLRDLDAVAANLHRRYTGVTSTVNALVACQCTEMRIAAMGWALAPSIARVPLRQLFTQGWSKPPTFGKRIWHARRNDEMIVGILLRHILRQPWKLVFTSAAQRSHTAFTRFLLRRMDAVIATTTQAAGYLNVPSRVINHGVDLQRFAPAADRENAWRETGLPGRYGIGTFGRIRKEKGTDIFVQSMIELLPRHPDWTAVISGWCAPKDQPFLEQLRQKIAAAGLEKRIVFLGLLPTQEVPAWFRRVTIYVAPMRWEGFGLTPLEAMASAAAVVATRTGAAEILVEHDVTGFIVEPGNFQAVTQAVERLMIHPQRAMQMGIAGRQKAQSAHDLLQEARAINAVYREVGGARGT
ncbi:MAG: glycosyltransferase family 4 protein [Burkholderiaceae bacterium]|jgi:mannosyltransferase|nr:glycosyltransferase family 4 protein [Burkholderiaceae bacterium]